MKKKKSTKDWLTLTVTHFFFFNFRFLSLTMVLPKSSETIAHGSTSLTGKTRIWLVQLAMPVLMHTWALSRVDEMTWSPWDTSSCTSTEDLFHGRASRLAGLRLLLFKQSRVYRKTVSPSAGVAFCLGAVAVEAQNLQQLMGSWYI